MAQHHTVFITGGTGYIGSRLATELVRRGHSVRALARWSSEGKVPPGCAAIIGDALDHRTYASQVPPADTFVHLVGVSNPSPAKAEQFRTIDLASTRQAVAAATAARVRHFVYVSVAHPAPVMKAYIAARVEAEAAIRASGLPATILQPWYVLGPGHRWPIMLLPLYWLFERLPPTRDGAGRLGLVRVQQMIGALCTAVEDPPAHIRVVDVPGIRRASLSSASWRLGDSASSS
ncbi:MAG: NAD(P)H-binding protein [Gemmatimonadetes bacterium]|nr:NAD(P)H-binding protein [Gemmatimonadota bacterium]